MTPFDLAFKHLMDVEGGFSNHKNDRGGPTKFGITLATLAAFCKTQVSMEDMKNLNEATAKLIYQNLYWTGNGLGQVKDTKLVCILFDQIVNRGPQTVIKYLQANLNLRFETHLKVDGKLGPKTASVINAKPALSVSLLVIQDAQKAYLEIAHRNPSQNVFLRGWLNRTWKLLDVLI